MQVQQNISLKPYNTFGVDVIAAYFISVKSVDELRKTIKWAKEKNISLLFLGGGSNLLLTKNIDALVIQMDFKGIEETILDENHVLVKAQAGENWHQFVQYCINKNFGGLENLSLIPGNVGTSPMQNIGAYGTEIKDAFESCEVLNLETLETEIFNLEKCRFGYRDSFFKQEGKGKYVILNVTFKLTTKNHNLRLDYGAIKNQLEEMNIVTPTIRDISNAVIAIRQSKLPDPKEIGNAGSFFKNPTIPTHQYLELKTKFENIPGYPQGETTKVPAGWLIEQAGWKGKQIGHVATHHLQALVIINKTGEAKGKEIFDFSTSIINSVKEKFGIELEREVNIL